MTYRERERDGETAFEWYTVTEANWYIFNLDYSRNNINHRSILINEVGILMYGGGGHNF